MGVFDQRIYDIPTISGVASTMVKSEIMIVSNDLTDNDKNLLGKILSSVDRKIEAAEIMSMVKTDHKKLESDHDCLVLVFGIHPRQLQLQIDNRPYGLRKVGRITYLFSRGLSALPDRPEERRALWETLKRYYKV